LGEESEGGRRVRGEEDWIDKRVEKGIEIGMEERTGNNLL
jgi:hypothetical protein